MAKSNSTSADPANRPECPNASFLSCIPVDQIIHRVLAHPGKNTDLCVYIFEKYLLSGWSCFFLFRKYQESPVLLIAEPIFNQAFLTLFI